MTMIALLRAIAITSAQDTWKPPTPTRSQSFRMGAASINRQGYIYTIAAKTDQAIDEKQMVLHLGNGRKEAMEAINRLIEFSELSVGNSLTFDDAILQVKEGSIQIVSIKDQFYFGEAYISDAELKKMKKFIVSGK